MNITMPRQSVEVFQTRRGAEKKPLKVWLRTIVPHAVLIFGAFLCMVPFFWMLTTSLKSDMETFQIPPTWLPSRIYWENYYIVLTGQAPPGAVGLGETGKFRGEGWSFFQFMWNTVVITAIRMVGRLLTASLAAYGFARLRFPGRDFWFIILLATMMLPYQVTMIPVYMIFQKLKMIDTYWPLTVGAFLGGGGFFIFLLRQFMMTISMEYDDAARIDGCGWFGTFWRIIVPMSGPALGAVAIFSFMTSWNDFLGPLIYLNTMSKYTLSIGLHFYRTQAGGGTSPLVNLTMAASVIAMLPPVLLFFFAQRYFIQGVVVSGLKG